MINYNIADLVSRINNNYIANKSLVNIPYTKDNYQILTQLTKLGIINIIGDIEIKDNPSSRKGESSGKKQEFIQIKLYPFCIPHSTITSPIPKGPSGGGDLSLQGPLPSLKGKGKEEKEKRGKLEEIDNKYEIIKKKENISFYFPLFPRKEGVGIKSKKILNLISKPGKRVYISYKNIKDFNHGHKLYLLRTSKGIITSQTALKSQIGGELLLKISYSFN